MVQRTKDRLQRARNGTLTVGIVIMMLIGSLGAMADHPGTSGFAIDGAVPDPGAVGFSDPSGNTKELGPENANTTKLGVIHTDPLPTLGLSNPNGQVDLINVWFDTNTANGTDWLYFAWQRDSTKGSGVIAIEFQQAAAPIACDYAGATTEALIDGCNPWANRQAGDFLLIWDQVGNDIVISVRVFNGTVFGPVDPLDVHEAAAILSADTSRGEAVIDLATIFPPEPTECLSIANVIPGTITGNSDTADYKDTVLADIAGAVTISNCGSIKIVKTDDVGSPLAGAGFTLYKSDGDDAFEPGFDDPIALDPDGANQTCTTGTDGTCVISDVLFGEYWVDETTVPTNYDKANGVPAKVTVSSTSQVTVGPLVNPRQQGSIIVEKVLDGTTTRINGAEFAIDADGNPLTTDDQTPISPVVGADGLFCIDQLLFAEYNVVESAVPDGYEAVTLVQKHTVSTKSDCSTVSESSTADLTFENTKLTSLVTSANQTVTVGATISDTATLSGGVNPTGTISFELYKNDNTCSVASAIVHTDSKTVTGNGQYMTSYETTSPGTYYWLASYSGDESNKASSHACGAAGEVDTVIKAKPTLVTSANETVTVGATISDTATLSGGVNPTGTISFELYKNDNTCSVASAIVHTDSKTVTGNGQYMTSYETTSPGTYYWLASYSGDDNNERASHACGAVGEVDTVDKANPSLVTTPKLLPNDSATLSGGFGTLGGSLTFELYPNADCSGGLDSIMFSQNVAVSGADTYNTTNTDVFITQDGTYSWKVTYSGDDNNNQAFSVCTAEQMKVDFTPLSGS